MDKIKNKSNSAAAVLCDLSKDLSFQERQKHFMEDIVGLVALLGTVHTNELSRSVIHFILSFMSISSCEH